MKRIVALFGLALATLATGALAADNAVVVTVGVGTTMRSKDIGAGVQSMVQILGDTAGTPMTFIGTNQTAPGNAIVIGGVVGTANTVSGNASPFFIDTSGQLKTTLGTATVTISGVAGNNYVAPHLVVGSGTFTTSGTAGSNFVAPVAIGSSPTLTTSAAAGSNTVSINSSTVTLTTSGTTGSNFVAPVAIGSAPTLTTSAVAGSNSVNINSAPITLTVSGVAGSNFVAPNVVVGSGTFTVSGTAGSNFIAPVAIGSAPTLVVSNVATALTTPVICVSGCSSGSVTVATQYNQVPATLVSGATANLQSDQIGSLKVNILSQAGGTLVVSQSAGSLLPQPIYAGTLTTSGLAGTNVVAPHAVTGSGTFTTSGVAGSNFVVPIAVGSSITLTTSGAANTNIVAPHAVTGSGTFTVSATTGSNFVAPVAIGSAPTLTVSAAANSVSWPPGTPTGITAGTAASGTTGSTIMAEASAGTVSVASGANSNLLTDTLSQLRVTNGASTTGGCTSAYTSASTTSVLTQVKATAGTLCWLRVINASAISATVRLYDTSSTGVTVTCGSSAGTGLVAYDWIQPNSVSPGMIDNFGPNGMAFTNGLAICLTAGNGSNFSLSDTTSLTTNAMFINYGYK